MEGGEAENEDPGFSVVKHRGPECSKIKRSESGEVKYVNNHDLQRCELWMKEVFLGVETVNRNKLCFYFFSIYIHTLAMSCEPL